MATATEAQTYKWSSGWKVGTVSPEVASEELERIRNANGGRLKPEIVVAAARNKHNPLHPAFEWDDSAAAEQWRLRQARDIICALVTIIPSAEQVGPVRAYVSVTHEDDDKPAYTTMTTAMAKPVLRQQVIAAALEELNGWRRRYQTYQELATLIAAIDSAVPKVRRKR